MGKDKNPKSSAFHRLKGDKQLKSSVFTKIKTGGKSSSSSPAQRGNFVVSRLGEENEVWSCIPLRMKLVSTLDIKTNSFLKAKRHTLVITSYEASLNSKEKINEDGQASSHLVTVREADDLKTETGSVKALEASENAKDFQNGPSNGKFLKCSFPRIQMLEPTPKYEHKLVIQKTN